MAWSREIQSRQADLSFLALDRVRVSFLKENERLKLAGGAPRALATGAAAATRPSEKAPQAAAQRPGLAENVDEFHFSELQVSLKAGCVSTRNTLTGPSGDRESLALFLFSTSNPLALQGRGISKWICYSR